MSILSLSASIIEFAIGNLAIALPLGLLAWWLQRRGTQHFLAHLLWLFVLVKLVTPPLYSLRIDAAAGPFAGTAALPYAPISGGAVVGTPDPIWIATLDWQVIVVGLWLAGSLIVLAWSSIRAYRFDRLLDMTSEPASREHQEIASRLTECLGLRNAPQVMVTAASISPMVWCMRGPARIYVPRSMIQQMDRAELCDILAHELGHVGRGDHYVRWLECLVGITLWWNPLAWWARRNLRACEEICCDAFVLSKTQASRDGYAGALVSAIELLAAPTIRPGRLASHVNGGFIERRIRMILSGKTLLQPPRWLRGLMLASAAVILPLGFTLAQEESDEIEKARQWLESGVNSAFLTQVQADIMLSALRAFEDGRFGGVLSVTPADDGGNVINLHPRVVSSINAGKVTLEALDVSRESVDLGDEIEGRRVVRIEAIPVESELPQQ